MNEISVDPVFVHREIELTLAWDRLSLLRAGKSVSEPILFFHGVPMVGKSALLRKINQRAVQNLIPTALIDFSEGFNNLSERERLIHEIQNQWESVTNIGPYNPISPQDDPDTAAQKLVKYAQQLHRGARPTPVALLLDTVETIGHETFAWLQQHLLEPILDEEKIFMVIAARAEYIELPVELSWPVSRRTRFIPLKTFSPEETQDHYKALLRKEHPTLWHKRLLSDPNWLTLGVPGLNEIAFQRPFETEKAGVTYMVEDVIFKRIAQGNIAESQDLILTMSAFRKFDYRILGQMANHFWQERYPEASRRMGVQLARQMKATMLMEMRQDGYGYVISPNLRRLLDDYQRYHEKKRHFETHYLAYYWFRNEVIRGDFVSIVDQIYHLASAWFDITNDHEKELEFPDDIPTIGQERSTILAELITNGMEYISDKSKADTQVEKAINVFQLERKEFQRLLSEEEMVDLIDFCKSSLEEAVKIADKHDGG